MPAARPYRPGDPVDLPALRRSLAGMPVDDSAEARQRAGSDFHWFSPLLAQRLAGRRPDLVVRPTQLAQLLAVVVACVRHRAPLTVRGGGTGNYGQCVPLFGGVSLDMTAFDRVLRIEKGWASVEAGVRMRDLGHALRARGQQLRMWPSTQTVATLGGFIAGGHSGIGSIRHGILADAGNVRRLRVVTLEDPPRVLDLQGEDIQKVHHAYGSNGIVVEVDIALADWVPWQHTIACLPSYEGVLRLGLAAGEMVESRTLDLFQLTAVERRITPFYEGLRARLQGQDTMFAQVAPATLPAYRALVERFGGRLVAQGSEAELLAQGLPSAEECAYNHTTLEALKSDRGLTYLQVAYPAPLDPALVTRQMQRFGDEVFMHHEFSRAGDRRVAFALPLVQYIDEAQLRELIHGFEADGCDVYDPHTWLLEDGGMKQVDEAQLAFKREADPLGLMNPGKVRGWDERVLGIAGGAA